MQYLLSFVFIVYATISTSFAQQCISKTIGTLNPINSLAQNCLSSACLLQREQYKCNELENELEGNEKNKIIQCDAKSLDENKLTNMSF